ncbi:MAG TPA: DUF4142 domain-containing protein [Terriglobia bacterium]|jgi:putative membrane protein
MKTQIHTFILGLILCLVAFGITACQRDNKTVQAAAEPNTAEEPAPAAANPDNPGTNVTNVVEGADRSFVMQAEKGNIEERMLGRLAQEKSQDSSVQDYGKMLSRDHNTALRQLVTLMNKYGIAQPPTLPEERKEAVNDVKGLTGQSFDRKFIDLMVKDHEKAIADFQHEASVAQNNDVKNYAQDLIPVLQKHLGKAKELQGKMESKPAGS